eukprot:TRINITY_DN11432_c0_g1_i1.p1 TRINITY_DN11432_c0_g1~~TRINITY_DN11432_c0_g1_i1.p1  ORF type:complete len:926 (-),score=159.42 TRINITY_DN11432_c0_g1_i1:146-2923(-)
MLRCGEACARRCACPRGTIGRIVVAVFILRVRSERPVQLPFSNGLATVGQAGNVDNLVPVPGGVAAGAAVGAAGGAALGGAVLGGAAVGSAAVGGAVMGGLYASGAVDGNTFQQAGTMALAGGLAAGQGAVALASNAGAIAQGAGALANTAANFAQEEMGFTTADLAKMGTETLKNAWPTVSQEEEDAAAFIAGAMYKEKMKRLNGRMKRYNTEFGRCLAAWIESVEGADSPKLAANSPSSLFQSSMHLISRRELPRSWDPEDLQRSALPRLPKKWLRRLRRYSGDSEASALGGGARLRNFSRASASSGASSLLQVGRPSGRMRSPLCLHRLVHHLSIERDEYMDMRAHLINPLLKSVADLHHGAAKILGIYPNDLNTVDYAKEHRAVAASYGKFMLEALLETWNNLVCRKLRVHSWSAPNSIASAASAAYAYLAGDDKSNNSPKKYKFVYQELVEQPNVGSYCLKECNNTRGWCDYCGGIGNGACCDEEPPPVEQQEEEHANAGFFGKMANFVTGKTVRDPEDYPAECRGLEPSTQSTPVCTPVSCIQKDSYYAAEKEDIVNETSDAGITPEECQSYCATTEATKFDFTPVRVIPPGLNVCRCVGEKAVRKYWLGYSSGHVDCPEVENVDMNGTTSSKQLGGPPTFDVNACEESEAIEMNFGEAASGELKQWVDDCITSALGNFTSSLHQLVGDYRSTLDRMILGANCSQYILQEMREDVANTQLAQDAAPGQDQISVFSIEGFTEGNPITIGYEANAIAQMSLTTIWLKTPLQLYHYGGEMIVEAPAERADYEDLSYNSVASTLSSCDWGEQKTLDAPKKKMMSVDYNNYEALNNVENTFPMPMWLHRRRGALECLKAKSDPRGDVEAQRDDEAKKAKESGERDISADELLHYGISMSRQVARLAVRLHVIEKWNEEKQGEEV